MTLESLIIFLSSRCYRLQLLEVLPKVERFLLLSNIRALNVGVLSSTAPFQGWSTNVPISQIYPRFALASPHLANLQLPSMQSAPGRNCLKLVWTRSQTRFCIRELELHLQILARYNNRRVTDFHGSGVCVDQSLTLDGLVNLWSWAVQYGHDIWITLRWGVDSQSSCTLIIWIATHVSLYL